MSSGNTFANMNARALTPDEEKAICQALQATWSLQTQPAFCPRFPSYNQCAQTAIVIYENFGGEILLTRVSLRDHSQIDHFYNRIGGQRYDFTDKQFEIEDFVKPIPYQDYSSSRQQAESTLQQSQLQAMRAGFAVAYKKEILANPSLRRDQLKPAP